MDGSKTCVNGRKADVDGQTRECEEDRIITTAVLCLFFKPGYRLKNIKMNG